MNRLALNGGFWYGEGVRWRCFSQDAYEARLRKTVDSMSDIPSDSATARAFAGEVGCGEKFLRTGSTAASWFPFLKPGSHRNSILVEEAIKLGSFGVLTLLYPESGSFSS